MGIKVINIMQDGSRLESLKGIAAPEILYEIILKDYCAKGMIVKPSVVAKKMGREKRKNV